MLLTIPIWCSTKWRHLIEELFRPFQTNCRRTKGGIIMPFFRRRSISWVSHLVYCLRVFISSTQCLAALIDILTTLRLFRFQRGLRKHALKLRASDLWDENGKEMHRSHNFNKCLRMWPPDMNERFCPFIFRSFEQCLCSVLGGFGMTFGHGSSFQNCSESLADQS